MNAYNLHTGFGDNTDLCVYRIHNEIAKSFGKNPLLDGCQSMHRHAEWMRANSKYQTLFIKMMHNQKYINYVPFRDYFSRAFFRNNPVKTIIKRDHQIEWIVENIASIHVKMDYIFNMNMSATRQMLYHHDIFHIYACCIPEYVDYCLNEIAMCRSSLAIIYETCANTTCDTLAERVFADEVTIATITGFL